MSVISSTCGALDLKFYFLAEGDGPGKLLPHHWTWFIIRFMQLNGLHFIDICQMMDVTENVTKHSSRL